jgi:hypothetical protein
MKGVVNRTILEGIQKEKSMTKIKKELKEVHKITISPSAFKMRYNAIKQRFDALL